MSISRKYGRTYHFDFSPGTTSDDRINRGWYEHIEKMDKTVDTEKLDGVLCDYVEAKKIALEDKPEIKYPQSQYGFFTDLLPMYMANYAWNWFLKSDEYEVFILTAPSLKNPLSYTEKRVWVEKNLGPRAVERLIISPRKDLNKGDYLIDDNLSGRGQDKFEGELIHFGSQRFQNWGLVIDYLQNKK